MTKSSPSYIFFCCIGLIYLYSFCSLYIQWPGLYGINGIMPVDNYVDRVRHHFASKTNVEQFYAFPSVVLLYDMIGVSVNGLCDFLMVTSIGISILVTQGVHTPFVFLYLWLSYLGLYLLGQPFLSFQWDILLLETGFLTVIVQLFKKFGSSCNHLNWCYRFMVWKLMFMAGVVKLQANCPTWNELTALEYHFATQPLPNQWAWTAHQMHPFFLRVGVAATFLIEIPATVLLLCPCVVLRRFGVVLQVLLQVMIMMTGNYTFFNLLTVALCIPAWANDIGHIPTWLESGHPGLRKSRYVWSWGFTLPYLQFLAGLLFLMGCCVMMFNISWLSNSSSSAVTWEDILLEWVVVGANCVSAYKDGFQSLKLTATIVMLDRIKLSLAPIILNATSLQLLVDQTILYCYGCCNCFMVMTAAVEIYREIWIVYQYGSDTVVEKDHHAHKRQQGYQRHKATKLMKAVKNICVLLASVGVAIVYLRLSVTPMRGISPSTPSNIPLPVAVQSLEEFLGPFSAVSGYGLFRKMTGVGKWTGPRRAGLINHIGGRKPSVVARPEIALEGYDADDNTWREISFRYKPTDLHNSPYQVAPHQPRLDWQMWFAALGSYQHQPWFISLTQKLLVGNCPEVIQLLDSKSYPFYHKPPSMIRSFKYSYDFTRMNTSWARRQPMVKLVADPRVDGWWHRVDPVEYVGVLEANNTSVLQFLTGNGIVIPSHRISVNEQYAQCRGAYDMLHANANGAASTLLPAWTGLVNCIICESVYLRETAVAAVLEDDYVLFAVAAFVGMFVGWFLP